MSQASNKKEKYIQSSLVTYPNSLVKKKQFTIPLVNEYTLFFVLDDEDFQSYALRKKVNEKSLFFIASQKIYIRLKFWENLRTVFLEYSSCQQFKNAIEQFSSGIYYFQDCTNSIKNHTKPIQIQPLPQSSYFQDYIFKRLSEFYSQEILNKEKDKLEKLFEISNIKTKTENFSCRKEKFFLQIITSLIYESKRHKIDSLAVAIRKKLLELIGCKETENLTIEVLQKYIYGQEGFNGIFFGVDLSSDSDSDSDLNSNLNSYLDLDSDLDLDSSKKDIKQEKKHVSPRQKLKNDLQTSCQDEGQKLKQLKKIKIEQFINSTFNQNEEAKNDLEQLNKWVKDGMTNEDIQEKLKKLKTKFYIAQFRGLTYSTSVWSASERRSHRKKQEIGKEQYSSATYKLEKQQIGNILNENSMRNTATKLRKILQVSKKIENVEVKIKKNKTKKYLSLYDYLQEEYTTNYYRFPQSLWNLLRIDGNPFVSTSDQPLHALKYAYGIKPYKGHEDERLRPRWRSDGRPERPKSGKVYVSLHPVEEYLYENQPTSVCEKVWKGNIFVENVIIAERETSFLGFMENNRVFYHYVSRYPSFKKYRSKYLYKYGLDEELYDYFRKLLIQNAPHSEIHRTAKKLLGQWLCAYHENRLINKVQQYCSQYEYVLVYRQYNQQKIFDFTLPCHYSPYLSSVDQQTRGDVKKITKDLQLIETQYQQFDPKLSKIFQYIQEILENIAKNNNELDIQNILVVKMKV